MFSVSFTGTLKTKKFIQQKTQDSQVKEPLLVSSGKYIFLGKSRLSRFKFFGRRGINSQDRITNFYSSQGTSEIVMPDFTVWLAGLSYVT